MKIKITTLGTWLLGISVMLGQYYAIEDGKWFRYDDCEKVPLSAKYILNDIWLRYYGNVLNEDCVCEDGQWYVCEKEKVSLEEVLERNRDFILAKLNEKASSF